MTGGPVGCRHWTPHGPQAQGRVLWSQMTSPGSATSPAEPGAHLPLLQLGQLSALSALQRPSVPTACFSSEQGGPAPSECSSLPAPLHFHRGDKGIAWARCLRSPHRDTAGDPKFHPPNAPNSRLPVPLSHRNSKMRRGVRISGSRGPAWGTVSAPLRRPHRAAWWPWPALRPPGLAPEIGRASCRERV